MKKVLLIGCGGYDNFGDEAMFRELCRIIKNQESEAEITAAYYNCDTEKLAIKYPNIGFKKLRSLHTRMGIIRNIFMNLSFRSYANNYDYLYIPGGGNLTSLYPTYVKDIHLLVKCFKRKGKYIEFRPQSLGPFFGESKDIDQISVKDIINKSNEFSVREQFSYVYAKELSKKVKLLHDDAWDIEIRKPDQDFDNSLENKKLIGLSVRPFNIQSDFLFTWFKDLVEELCTRGYTPFFIPISYNNENLEYRDNYFLKSVIKDKGIFLEDIVDIKTLEPENIKFFISICEKCIGLSYHFNVFSLSLGKKVVSLYYEDYYKIKNLGLQEAFGDPKNVINPINTNVNQVISLLE